MANLVLHTLFGIAVALASMLFLMWIDHIRGKRGRTSRATLWFAGIIVVWMILDTLGVLIPAYQADALLD